MYISIMAEDGCFPNWSVYIISCKDKDINASYIGKTNDFKRRKAQHRSLTNNANAPHHSYRLYRLIREFGGWENFDMVEIKGGLDNIEATEIERKLYIDLKPYMNTQYPGRTIEQYHIDNKERIAQYNVMKSYKNPEKAKATWTKNNAKNRERINKLMRENRIKNREKIAARDRIKYGCICGAYINHRGRAAHIRTAGHHEGVRCFSVCLNNVKKEILRL